MVALTIDGNFLPILMGDGQILNNKYLYNYLEIAHPQSGSSSTRFLVELEFGNAGFLGEGKTGVLAEKPLGAKDRTNIKLSPHLASMPRFKPGPHHLQYYTDGKCRNKNCLKERGGNDVH